jgi:peptidyl-prolyl cis-trans isomerase C
MIRLRSPTLVAPRDQPQVGAEMPHGRQSPWRGQSRRLTVLVAAGLLLAAAGPVPATPGVNSPSRPGDPNPVVASVEGHPIRLSDLGEVEQVLPPDLRNLPFQSLYPIMLDRMVDHEALVMLARRRDLEDDPAVKKQIEEATERVLESALLSRDAAPKVTEDAIKARYDQMYANHPATAQVRARHILVGTEAEAMKIIAELRKGADFPTLARQDSKDPDGQKGGELGFFSRDQVWPAFADVAFALQPGQVADKPVHNAFGWHVVQVEERRVVPPPSYADVHDALRDQLMQEAVRQEVALARGQLIIHEWNLNGSSADPGVPPADAAEKRK